MNSIELPTIVAIVNVMIRIIKVNLINTIYSLVHFSWNENREEGNV